MLNELTGVYPSRLQEIDNASIVSIESSTAGVIASRRDGSESSVSGEFAAQSYAAIGSSLLPETAGVLPEWYLPFASNIQLPKIAPTPAGQATSIAWSRDSIYLAVSLAVSPYIMVYKRSNRNFSKLPDPATLPAGPAQGIVWGSANPLTLFVPHSSFPYISMYGFDGTTLTKLSDPYSFPSGQGVVAAYTFDFGLLLVGSIGSIKVYYRSGTRLINSSSPNPSPSGGTPLDAQFASSGNGCIIGWDVSPYLISYTVLSDNSILQLNPVDVSPPGPVKTLSISSRDSYVAVGHDALPYVSLYTAVSSASRLYKLPDLPTPPAGPANVVRWSPDGRYLMVGHANAPYITMYKFDSGVATKLPDLSPSPPSAVNGASFSPDGRFLAVTHATTPYVTVYACAGDSYGGLPYLTTDSQR